MLPMAGTPLFDVPLDLILWGGVAVMLVVFNVYSAILYWHWRTYSTGRFTTMSNLLIFVGVGIGLLVVMGVAALSYSLV